ncbi:MAG TPA: Uma2 family endonuclease [Polyangiaceae bacterium]|nr:Uma2 family endonuclease [Polyangiaceae bacterium]
MSAFPLHRYTVADYVQLERDSPIKHEFLDGEIVAMAGGTPEHAALASAFGYQLGSQLQGSPCRVFSSDLRVRVPATGLTTYPDLTVVCGRTERDAEDPLAINNPKLLVEITSNSSEDYDRGAKLDHFKTLASVAVVVVVSHREELVEVFTRSGEDWIRTVARGGERASLVPLGVHIDVDALYAAAREPTV